MRNKANILAGIVVLSTLALAACSQGTDFSGDKAKDDAGKSKVKAATADAPPPFGGKVRVAIVQQSGQGDYFQQYLNGTKQQAEALGVELSVFDAQGNNASQSAEIDQAISAKVDGLIVRHGLPNTICPGVNKAIDRGIPVIVYDVEVRECAPKAIQAQQSDKKMAGLVLDQMVKGIGKDQAVGYVNVSGIAPLDRRDAVWKQYVKTNGWDQQFKTGTYTNSTASDSAPMVTSALRAHPNVKAIYAPYDELSKATLSAIEQVSKVEGKVAVYGADISTADIELMRKKDSPWKATGATDPNAIGAAVMRTLALHMAGQLDEQLVMFPPILITQDFLRENDIKNMTDLRDAEPELNITNVSSADWIPAVNF